jgi:hypothetical protein
MTLQHTDGLRANPGRVRYEASRDGVLQRALPREKIGPERAAVDGLVASYDRRPRTLKLRYLNPTMEPILRAGGRVRRTRGCRGLRTDLLSHRLCVSEVLPAGVSR